MIPQDHKLTQQPGEEKPVIHRPRPGQHGDPRVSTKRIPLPQRFVNDARTWTPSQFGSRQARPVQEPMGGEPMGEGATCAAQPHGRWRLGSGAGVRLPQADFCEANLPGFSPDTAGGGTAGHMWFAPEAASGSWGSPVHPTRTPHRLTLAGVAAGASPRRAHIRSHCFSGAGIRVGHHGCDWFRAGALRTCVRPAHSGAHRQRSRRTNSEIH